MGWHRIVVFEDCQAAMLTTQPTQLVGVLYLHHIKNFPAMMNKYFARMCSKIICVLYSYTVT